MFGGPIERLTAEPGAGAEAMLHDLDHAALHIKSILEALAQDDFRREGTLALMDRLFDLRVRLLAQIRRTRLAKLSKCSAAPKPLLPSGPGTVAVKDAPVT